MTSNESSVVSRLYSQNVVVKDTLESTPVALDSTMSCSAPGSAATTTVPTAGAGKTAASPSSKQTEVHIIQNYTTPLLYYMIIALKIGI